MYIPLFNTSNYTIQSSLLKIKDIVEYAKKSNIPSIALTDTNMFGTMEFIKSCEENGIKPIIGLKVNLSDSYIILIAKNYDGYKNLLKLSTIQSENIINEEILIKYKKDLIAIVPYQFSSYYEKLSNIYIDIYLGYSSKEEENNAIIITKKIVFLRESLYLYRNEKETLAYLYRIRDGKTVSDEVEYDLDNHELTITNIYQFSSEKGVENTFNIAEQCNIEFPKSEILLPVYECDNPQKYLFDLCRVGLSKRLNNEIPNNYKERLVYELNIINEMGFSNYFLVVYDYIKFAKKNKILVGPGRGSAAGSLVAYSLGITDIDPIKYDLIFERFLNPERKTMPDIDTDFPDNKRQLVIDYVKDKYGEKKVSGIIVFSTFTSKQVIRDVSRVLNIPLYKVESITKLITNASEKLLDLYNSNETFKVRIDSDIILTNMFKIALKIEGLIRHTSVHPAGIIMSKINLDEVIPLTKSNNMYLSGYSMEYLEELGLLKMDFLVVKTLTMIDEIISDINNKCNEEIDFSKIPLDDKETIEMFATANTCGIFQFESSGMKSLLKRLKPTSIEDIFAAIALFRPGAASYIDTYVKRKNNEEEVKYLDKSLEDITKNTYGILIYQEQIIQVASAFAGYTLGEADVLRRAMSKKKLELLKSEEEKFIEKSIEKGHSKEQAKQIFDLILNFAGYGFNKAHSVVYSIIAYKMAYLKCHYKTVFFANLLTSVIGSEVKTNEYIMEAKANKINIEKPTINNSTSKYVIKGDTLIYPISNIKGIGSVVSDQINQAKENGKFSDIYDCFSRLYIAGLGKKTLETLIFAGVFKEFGHNKATLVYNLDSLINYAELTKDIDPSLVMKPELEIQKEYSKSTLLEYEKEVFGFYLSSHPTTMFRKQNPYCIPLNAVEKYFDKTIDTLILVDKVKIINTKKGDKMAFINGSDETASFEFTLFPKVFKTCPDIGYGDLLKIRGQVQRRLNEYQIVVEKIKKLEEDNNEE